VVLLNPTPSTFGPLLAASGDTIHACGIQPHGVWGGFVHYSRSLDGGRTWPTRELPLGYALAVTDLAAEGDLVVVLVHSPFFGPHTITSTDGGTTWALPVRVSQQSVINTATKSHVCIDGTTVNVIWAEPRPVGRVWANRSTDNGATWQPNDTRLDAGTTPHPTSTGIYGLEVIAGGAKLHALWDYYSGTGPATVHQGSGDGGVSWQAQPNLVVSGSMKAAGGDGNLLFVSPTLLQQNQRSTDGGATWAPVAVPGMVACDSVAVDGQNVLFTRLASAFAVKQLFINASRDGGVTWLPQPYTVTTDRTFVSRAFVFGDVFLVHVRFWDNELPIGSVIQSDDLGVSWRLVTDEAALGLWPSSDRLVATTVASVGSTSVWAYVLAGHTALGSGTPGTGGLVPSLDGVSLPTLGRTFTLQVGDARGGSTGAIVASFAAALPVPLGTATLYVQPPVVPLLFWTSAAGAASQSVTVPVSTTFAGLSMTSQAFVLDPVAADGFTATRALETWIN